MAKLLFLGQYPIDELNSAPKIRTYHLYQSTKELIDTDFITGTRNSRRWPMIKYLISGKLFKVKAVYLESATSTSSETDLLFLIIAKLLGKTIGIYIRDAFPLFGLTDKSTLKNKFLVYGWYISIWFYKLLADILFFPTETLAKVFKLAKYEILPPGGVSAPYKEFTGPEKGLLYCGGISDRYGITHLLEAVEILFEKHKDIRLFFVCRKGEEKYIEKWREREWLTILHLNYDEIIELRDKIYLSVIPIVKDKYNDLAMPVKMFDYMSLGRPVVVTDCTEMKAFLNENDIGLICESNSKDMANKIDYLLNNFELAEGLGYNAHRILNKSHLWEKRSEKIIDTLNNFDRKLNGN